MLIKALRTLRVVRGLPQFSNRVRAKPRSGVPCSAGVACNTAPSLCLTTFWPGLESGIVAEQQKVQEQNIPEKSERTVANCKRKVPDLMLYYAWDTPTGLISAVCAHVPPPQAHTCVHTCAYTHIHTRTCTHTYTQGLRLALLMIALHRTKGHLLVWQGMPGLCKCRGLSQRKRPKD